MSFDTWVMQMTIVRDELASGSTASWLNPFIAREEYHSRMLRTKSPHEWARDILVEIKDKNLRNRVACVVWWDFFAQRPIHKRWPHLDRYIDADFAPVDDDTLARGLAAVGYAPWHAVRRICPSVNYHAAKPGNRTKRGYTARKIPRITISK